MPRSSLSRLAALLAIVPTLIDASPAFRNIGRAPSTVSCPNSNGQIVTTGTSSFLITCDYDYWGGDITMSWETNLSNCLATCSTTTGCIAVSYNGGACYMKDSAASGQSNYGVWAAKQVSTPSSSSASVSPTFSTTTTSPASVATTTPAIQLVSCPDSDGLTYTASDGAAYLVQCSTDYYGGDLSVSWESSLGSCIETCEATPDCVDVAYRPGTPGPCYLKSTARTPVSNSEVWGAILATATAASTTPLVVSSTSSSASSSTASPAGCPAPTCSPAGPISSGTIMDPGFETPGTTPDWALIDGQLGPDEAGDFYSMFKNGEEYSAHSGTHYGHQVFGLRTDWGKFGTTILDLTPCAQYTVTFWVMKNVNAQAIVSVEGCSLDTVPLGGSNPYVQYSFTFTASDTTATFAITGSCPDYDGPCGLLYDDFSIAPVQVSAATSTISTTSSASTMLTTSSALTTSTITSASTTSTTSSTPRPSGCGVIVDADFETPGTTLDWTVIQTIPSSNGVTVAFENRNGPAGTAHGGNRYGYQSIFSGGGGYFGTTVSGLNSGTPYNIEYWIKKNVYADIWIIINGVNGNVRIPPISAGGVTNDTIWYHQSFATMAFSSSITIEFDTTCPGYAGQCDVYWDDFSVYPLTRTPAGCR